MHTLFFGTLCTFVPGRPGQIWGANSTHSGYQKPITYQSLTDPRVKAVPLTSCAMAAAAKLTGDSADFILKCLLYLMNLQTTHTLLLNENVHHFFF